MVDQATILTAIGAGTAFALLLLLTILIAIVGWVVLRVEGRLSRESTEPPSTETLSDSAQAKALAAVAGVTAVMQEETTHQGKPPSRS